MAAIAEVQAVGVAPPWRRLRDSHPLAMYLVRRIGAGVISIVVASILVYLAILVLPGDVAQLVLGKNATPDRVAAINAQINGDAPVWTRYLTFMGDFLRGDLGYSTAGLVQGVQTPISGLIKPAFSASTILAAITLVLFIPVMLALGLLAGLKSGSKRDTVISVGSLAISSLPEFLVGTVLITIFFGQLNVLPPVSDIPPGESVLGHPKSLVLPIATLLLVSLAFGSRMLRASVAEVMNQDYVLTARINGYSERDIVRKYVLPNALIPTIQIVAQQMQYLIAGIIVVESVFNYPGIGNTLVRAILVQDTQEITVIAMILATLYIGINLAADLICVLLDPKVRTTLS